MGILSFEVAMGTYDNTAYPIHNMTYEQMDIYEEFETLLCMDDKATIIRKITKYAEFLHRADYAEQMFPCKGDTGKDCVRGNIVSKIRLIKSEVQSHIDFLIKHSLPVFGDDFYKELTAIVVNLYESRRDENKEKWEAISWDRKPESQKREHIQLSHEQAIQENQQFNKRKKQEAFINSLTPEQLAVFKEEYS